MIKYLFRTLRIYLYPHIKRSIVYKYITNNKIFGKFLNSITPPLVGSRRYINPEIGISHFFNIINERKVKYVVLRWFEDLPIIDEGEDIDLFVDDSHINYFDDLLVSYPRVFPIDLYSQTILTWNDLPYYTPEIFNELLINRSFKNKLFWIPNQSIYARSLAYHALYHKKNIFTVESISNSVVHSYTYTLKSIAPVSHFLEGAEDLDSLNVHQALSSYSPHLSLLRKYHQVTGGLSDIIPFQDPNVFCKGELIIFTIRDETIKNGKLESILSYLSELDYFLEVLSVIHLTDDQKIRAKNFTRGGIWKKGTFPISGGPPSVMIVTFDFFPDYISLSKRLKSYPYIQNAHVFIKDKIRDLINKDLPKSKHFNGIHSTDDDLESLDDLSIVFKGFPEHGSIKNQYKERTAHYCTNEKVKKVVRSNTRRSKMYIVSHNNEYFLKKVYKQSFLNHLKRELDVYEALSHSNYLPELVEVGSSYMVTRWYDNQFLGITEKETQMLLKLHRNDIKSILKLFYDNSIAHLDFHPGNLILCPDNGLKVTDFEFSYKYSSKPDHFHYSYDVVGVPHDFPGDLPRGTVKPGITYENTWQKILGPLQPASSNSQ
jgi:hypothetical protein